MTQPLRFDSNCANLLCHNKPGDCEFFIVQVDNGLVGDEYRSLRFRLCAECAKAMEEQVNGG